MEKDQIVRGSGMIVMGGSAGSLDALINILGRLHPMFSIPMLIITHRNTQHESLLSELLSVRSGLIVKEVEEKETIRRGIIYVAPADYHVLVEKDKSFSLDYSEKEQHSRPSIDVSFYSASMVFGHELTGIILSGANSDGAEGQLMIKKAGGYTIVQDPLEATIDHMPRKAIRSSNPDLVTSVAGIANYLNQLDPKPSDI
jgi:two-component system chemotaxis response regulator CheB